MSDLQELEKLVENHLNIDENSKQNLSWRIDNSPLEGRGVFATRDIQVGEIIFKNSPLIVGPRAGVSAKLHCVICLKISNLMPCTKGCGLPVCSFECEQNLNHFKECEFIKNHNGNMSEISIELFRSLTPLRALLMEASQQKLLLSLASHCDPKHGFEVELLKSKINLSESEEDLLRKICYVLDANAFETMVESKEGFEDFSLRGLYAVGALLNHSCVPNTTHLFDDNQRMIVKSCLFIPKGAEILTTYTTLLWATAARRHHLWTTKHFYCRCTRCQDPKEFNSCLSGLKCTLPSSCNGILYPLDAMDIRSKWKCDLCGFLLPRSSIGMIQSLLGSLLLTVDMRNPLEVVKLLKERIHKVVAPKNHIAVELKCRVVWTLGRTEGNLWNGKNLISKEFHYFVRKLL